MRVLVTNFGNTSKPLKWTDSENCIAYNKDYRTIHWGHDTGLLKNHVTGWRNGRSFSFAVFIDG